MAKKAAVAANENLAFRTYKAEGDRKGHRRVGDAVDDTVADQLAKAQTPTDMIKIAVEQGIPKDVATEKAGRAPNFGQFRMTIGNLIRGIASRQAHVKTITGSDVDAATVGTKKLMQAHMAEWRKANRPVKDGEKKAKKDAAKKDKTVEVRKGGKKDAAASADEVREGAPSKAEAAGRGRGKKAGSGKKQSRWQRNKSKSGDGDAAAGVDEAGSGQSEQTNLADAVAEANA